MQPSEQAAAVPNARINGVHHLAVSTRDIKAQIEFFTDVLGGELVALFWMHGVPGGYHAFIRLNDHCSMSFVELPAMHDIEPEMGLSHPGTAAGVSAPGTMQHVAFSVDSFDELIAMRDRIRSKGVNVIGQLDHGLCQSIYFAGPENMALEVATSAAAIDAERWIDPEVVALAGISSDELERYKRPGPVAGCGGSVPQPLVDPAKPHLAYPPRAYDALISTPDDQVTSQYSYSRPPVEPAPSSR